MIAAGAVLGWQQGLQAGPQLQAAAAWCQGLWVLALLAAMALLAAAMVMLALLLVLLQLLLPLVMGAVGKVETPLSLATWWVVARVGL